MIFGLDVERKDLRGEGAGFPSCSPPQSFLFLEGGVKFKIGEVGVWGFRIQGSGKGVHDFGIRDSGSELLV